MTVGFEVLLDKIIKIHYFAYLDARKFMKNHTFTNQNKYINN